MSALPTVEDIAKRFDQKYKDNHTPWNKDTVSDELIRFMDTVTSEIHTPRVLDIGCGTGWTCRYFAERGCDVLGVDSSSTAIDTAIGAGVYGGAISYVCKEGISFLEEYTGDTFDAVCDRGFLHHVPEKYWDVYFSSIKRMLKKDGFMYLGCFSDDSVKKGFDPKKEEKLWNIVEEKSGLLTYDHFFTPTVLEELFGSHFQLVWQDKDVEASQNGSILYHSIFQKK